MVMNLFSIIFVKPQDNYHPMWPQWARWLGWAVRNPFPGLIPPLQTPLVIWKVERGVVLLVTHPVPTWNPSGGYWHLALRNIDAGPMRHFRSYRGKLIECYFGWRPNGSFGIAFRKANSKGF